jgi:hypothetical protein
VVLEIRTGHPVRRRMFPKWVHVSLCFLFVELISPCVM